jgi:hypothetical protein
MSIRDALVHVARHARVGAGILLARGDQHGHADLVEKTAEIGLRQDAIGGGVAFRVVLGVALRAVRDRSRDCAPGTPRSASATARRRNARRGSPACRAARRITDALALLLGAAGHGRQQHQPLSRA